MKEAFQKILDMMEKSERSVDEDDVQLVIKLSSSKLSVFEDFVKDAEQIASVLKTVVDVPVTLFFGEQEIELRGTVPRKIWNVDGIDGGGSRPTDLTDEVAEVLDDLARLKEQEGELKTRILLRHLTILLGSEKKARLEATFRITRQSISRAIKQRIPETKDVNILLFFVEKNCSSFLKRLSFKDCRQKLFGDKDRCLVLHMDQGPDGVGQYLGIIRISPIDSISRRVKSFAKQKVPKISHKKELLKRSSIIRNLSELIIPEQLKLSSTEVIRAPGVWDDLAPLFLGMIILSISSEAYLDGGRWFVTIRGYRWLHGQLWLENGMLNVGNMTKASRIASGDALNFGIKLFGFYRWMFEKGDFDKIALARNTVSFFARNLYDVLQKSSDILPAARSNYELYLKKATDEFIEKKMKVTDYIFEHHKVLTGFQSSLTSKVSTDSFRILGSLVVFGIGVFSDFLSEPLSPWFVIIGLLIISTYVFLSILSLRDVKEDFEASHQRYELHLKYYMKYLTDDDVKPLEPGHTSIQERFHRRYYVWSAIFLDVAIVLLEIAILYVLGL